MEVISKSTLLVKSRAFEHLEFIPKKYTCDGENVNPELIIKDFPVEAKSLVLIVDDPDAPGGNYIHWLMWNIPLTGIIKENSAPGVQGLNSEGENKYQGPCPTGGTHHYRFKIYALDIVLDLAPDTNIDGLTRIMKGRGVGVGEITGLYRR